MRTMTPAMAEELDRTVKRPALFYDGEFESGWVRIWTGDRDIAFNGVTFVSATRFAGAGITAIEETGEVQATGIAVSLSGVPLEQLQIAIEEARQGKPGTVWLGFVSDGSGDGSDDPAEDELIAEPAVAFRGRLDVPEIDDDGQTATVTISYESRLVDLERPRERRYTNEDQQIDYPGDKGFEYVATIQEWNGVWGRS